MIVCIYASQKGSFSSPPDHCTGRELVLLLTMHGILTNLQRFQDEIGHLNNDIEHYKSVIVTLKSMMKSDTPEDDSDCEVRDSCNSCDCSPSYTYIKLQETPVSHTTKSDPLRVSIHVYTYVWPWTRTRD